VVHDRRTFVEKVDFVTQSGNLARVVTPLAVMEMRGGGLELGSVHPGVSVEEVVGRTGFPLDLGAEVPETIPPTEDELAALAEIDPEGVRYSEFAALRRVER
jgi:glutaconate CoA-transferase subunit B